MRDAVNERAEQIQREVRVNARPEIVFAHFTDPERYVRWKGRRAWLDPRPGGIFRVDINGRDVARGEFLEVVPYRRIVFSWGWEAEGNPVPPGSSTVEVTLEPDGAGTIVRLVHRGLPSAARTAHLEGWDHYLPRLTIAATGGDPGVDASERTT